MTLRLAVVGSGPAGFFLTKSLTRHLPGCTVDILERLPCPFGLIRYGVAPDHSPIKSVTADFSAIATTPGVRFLGNVQVGSPSLPLSSLRNHYSAVIYAYGAAADRSLHIPGEQEHIHSARSFVEWYNTHPESTSFDLSSTPSVAIIGNGNVAVDVARILSTPVYELRSTDISHKAYMTLENSAVKDIHIIGRRGALQAACAIKELRQLTNVEGVHVRVYDRDLQESQTTDTNQASFALLRVKKRLVELLSSLPKETGKNARVQVHFHFLQSPVEATPTGLRLRRNTLKVDSEGEVKAVGTEEYSEMKCDLVLRSAGYRTTAIDTEVPFDEGKGVVRTQGGRVDMDYPVYAAGWCQSGPVGILDATMRSAFV